MSWRWSCPSIRYNSAALQTLSIPHKDGNINIPHSPICRMNMTTICVNQFPNVFGNWHILGYLSAIFHFINNMNNTFLERRSSISCCGDDLSPRSPRWRPERWRRSLDKEELNPAGSARAFRGVGSPGVCPWVSAGETYVSLSPMHSIISWFSTRPQCAPSGGA